MENLRKTERGEEEKEDEEERSKTEKAYAEMLVVVQICFCCSARLL